MATVRKAAKSRMDSLLVPVETPAPRQLPRGEDRANWVKFTCDKEDRQVLREVTEQFKCDFQRLADLTQKTGIGATIEIPQLTQEQIALAAFRKGLEVLRGEAGISAQVNGQNGSEG